MVGAGTLFYHYYTGFYWSQAFFYAVDTGFSIGFGMFVEGAWNDSNVYIPNERCTLESCADGRHFNGSLREACVQLSYRPDDGSMMYVRACGRACAGLLACQAAVSCGGGPTILIGESRVTHSLGERMRAAPLSLSHTLSLSISPVSYTHLTLPTIYSV